MCLNFIVSWIVVLGISLGIAVVLDLIISDITDAELLTKQNLAKAYEIGVMAGMIMWIILQPIYKKIGNYVWNWKKKRTVGSFIDDGGADLEKSFSDIENGRKGLN